MLLNAPLIMSAVKIALNTYSIFKVERHFSVQVLEALSKGVMLNLTVLKLKS